MHFDALATACMAAELQARLCPGRIQQVLLVDANSIGLEVYAHGERRQLLLCAQPGRARLHLVAQKLRRGVEQETPLLLLLRKYARDATLTAVRRPDPFDRVLHLEVEHRETGRATIVIEMLGRQSNLFLVNAAERILAGLHQVQPVEAGRRALTPGSLYAPPVQARLAPVDDGRPDYYERLAGLLNQPGKLAKALADGLAGISPSAARELAWRTTGDAEAPAGAANVLALAAALQALWAPLETGAWQPGITRAPGDAQPGAATNTGPAGEPITGFFAYHAHTYGLFTPTETLSEAVAAWAAAAPEPAAGAAVMVDPYAGQRGNVRAELRRATQQVRRRLAALAADEPAPGEAGRTRQAAEWLLALSSQVQPGQPELVVPLDDATLVIPLDARLGPVMQAEGLFKRAAKLERAAVFIPQRRAQLEQDLALLDQLGYDLDQATNQPEIAAVRAELRAAGLGPKEGTSGDRSRRAGGPSGTRAGAPGPSASKAGQPLRFRGPGGFEIVVGRNARQNEHVTFAIAHPGDWWLHVRGQPGAHVVVKGAGREPDTVTLQAAAQLAAYYSSARGERAADVILARKRDVSRAPGGKVGQVMVAKEKVLAVPAELPPAVAAIK